MTALKFHVVQGPVFEKMAHCIHAHAQLHIQCANKMHDRSYPKLNHNVLQSKSNRGCCIGLPSVGIGRVLRFWALLRLVIYGKRNPARVLPFENTKYLHKLLFT